MGWLDKNSWQVMFGTTLYAALTRPDSAKETQQQHVSRRSRFPTLAPSAYAVPTHPANTAARFEMNHSGEFLPRMTTE